MADNQTPGPSRVQFLRAAKNKILTKKELEDALYASDDDFSDVLSDPADYGWVDSDSEGNGESAVMTTYQDTSQPEKIRLANLSEHTSWSSDPTGLRKITFSEIPGLKFAPPLDAKPVDYFFMLAGDYFFEMVVNETNIYAEQLFLQKGQGRISEWKPVTKEELKVFIGLLLHMGTIQCARVQDYWKTHRLFNIPCFRSYMSRNRFLLILRCLHFSRNPVDNEPQPEDRLYKVKTLIDYFNEKMEAIYVPQKQLSLDESMVLYRGRLVFRQYIKNKRHKYGIKLYVLTESSGLILKFAVYTGVTDDLGGTGHAANVVLHLMQNNLNKGYSLYMDNFYNSFTLAKQLLEAKTYCSGTLRANRKQNPEDVVKQKLKPGETVCRYSNEVVIGKWRDRRDVLYISTEHENDLVETFNKRGQSKLKPKPIAEYNRFMSGVDFQDQIMSYYPFTRKTIRWYKKLGLHIIYMMLYNSYLLYNKHTNKKLSFYDFRMSVIEEILPEKSPQTPKKPTLLEHLPSKCPKKK